MRARHAAVVGATGFVGRRLTAALRRSGVRVTEYTRGRPFTGTTAHDVVYWLAASITPASAESRPDLVAADVDAFHRALDALARGPRPPAVVLTSSAGCVYHPDVPGPWRECDPLGAVGRYGQTKIALERRLAAYPGPGTVLRLSNVYGVGQPAAPGQGVLAHWVAAAARGDQLRLIGDPATTRDFVNVDDVAESMVLVAADVDRPLVLNIASGHSVSLGDLAAEVGRAAGRSLDMSMEPARTVDRRESSVDVSRAATELGWRARTRLCDGVAAMWATATGRPVVHEPAYS